jgi:Ca2+-binding RTX toxin-like protein
VDEYVLLDPKGQGVFDISLLGSHFVLINQTATTFETLMKQQIGDIASGNDINMTFMGEAGAETVKGTAFRDFLSGGGGNDHLYGGAGADDLLGGVGADVLIGGRGKDNLNGQSGVDQLTGGFGADHFNFTGMVTRASGDTITDFQSSQGDKIDLSRLDAIDGTVGLDHFAFIQTGAFDGNKGELRYEAETGGVVVQGDTNGDGTADFTLHLQNVTTLQATDFILA